MYRVESMVLPEGPAAWRLWHDAGLADVLIVPERGAWLADLQLGGLSVLRRDSASLSDQAQPQRGGAPLLFPFAGRLADNRYEHAGITYTLPQHGFARHMAFEVRSHGAGILDAHLELRLRSDHRTLPLYPWAFELRIRYTLEPGRLRTDVAIENLSDHELPHALGVHPYVSVPADGKVRCGVRTGAKRAFDAVVGHERLVTRLQFDAPELNVQLLDHPTPGTIVRRGGALPGVAMQWSEAFGCLTLWTRQDDPFICVEPWVARAGTFPSGPGVRRVAPGQTDRLWWTFGLTKSV